MNINTEQVKLQIDISLSQDSACYAQVRMGRFHVQFHNFQKQKEETEGYNRKNLLLNVIICDLPCSHYEYFLKEREEGRKGGGRKREEGREREGERGSGEEEKGRVEERQREGEWKRQRERESGGKERRGSVGKREREGGGREREGWGGERGWGVGGGRKRIEEEFTSKQNKKTKLYVICENRKNLPQKEKRKKLHVIYHALSMNILHIDC